MKNLSPTVSIVAGILILFFPDEIRIILAIYLIVTGIMAIKGKK